MEHVYTFTENQGDRLGASSDPNGANLPGGASAWTFQAKLKATEMDADAGVVGLGNARAILDQVRAQGFAVAGPGSMVM